MITVYLSISMGELRQGDSTLWAHPVFYISSRNKLEQLLAEVGSFSAEAWSMTEGWEVLCGEKGRCLKK